MEEKIISSLFMLLSYRLKSIGLHTEDNMLIIGINYVQSDKDEDFDIINLVCNIIKQEGVKYAKIILNNQPFIYSADNLDCSNKDCITADDITNLRISLANMVDVNDIIKG